jgi:hypothetical protein
MDEGYLMMGVTTMADKKKAGRYDLCCRSTQEWCLF